MAADAMHTPRPRRKYVHHDYVSSALNNRKGSLKVTTQLTELATCIKSARDALDPKRVRVHPTCPGPHASRLTCSVQFRHWVSSTHYHATTPTPDNNVASLIPML